MNRYHDPIIDEGFRRCNAIVGATGMVITDQGVGYNAGTVCNLLPEEHEQPTVWRAWYESRSFTFEAYGVTVEDAREALIAGLEAHTRQYKLWENDWWDVDGIGVAEFWLGQGYRDSELVDGPIRPGGYYSGGSVR